MPIGTKPGRNVSWVTLLKIFFTKFLSVLKHGAGEWGFLHYTDMKKFLKNLLLRNRRSDFEIILQESGFDINRRPDCLIRAIIATGNLPSPCVSPPGE